MFEKILAKFFGRKKFNSIQYWESRYAGGNNSGDGSYGDLAQFKAEFMNQFLKEHEITSVIELGCGDGNQLSKIQYPQYTGMDVSSTIISACKNQFKSDPTKRFEVYNPQSFFPQNDLKADLSLSLDVLYHIVEERNYFKYLSDLFSLGRRFVIIYSTNFYCAETSHVLHRKFTDDVNKLFPDWRLVLHLPNKYPGDGEQQSRADFFVFEK